MAERIEIGDIKPEGKDAEPLRYGMVTLASHSYGPQKYKTLHIDLIITHTKAVIHVFVVGYLGERKDYYRLKDAINAYNEITA